MCRSIDVLEIEGIHCYLKWFCECVCLRIVGLNLLMNVVEYARRV